MVPGATLSPSEAALNTPSHAFLNKIFEKNKYFKYQISTQNFKILPTNRKKGRDYNKKKKWNKFCFKQNKHKKAKIKIKTLLNSQSIKAERF